jgi:hypothetical protein
MLIEREKSCLLVVGAQEKLAPAVTDSAAVCGRRLGSASPSGRRVNTCRAGRKSAC